MTTESICILVLIAVSVAAILTLGIRILMLDAERKDQASRIEELEHKLDQKYLDIHRLGYQLGRKISENAELHTRLAEKTAEAQAFDDAACKHNARANQAERECKVLTDVLAIMEVELVEAEKKIAQCTDRPRGKGGRFESPKTKAAGL